VEKRLAPAPPLPPVTPLVVSRGAEKRRVVALTFDACEIRRPSGYDRGVIDTLVKEHVPATLFLGGHWMWTHAATTRALALRSGPGHRPLFELGSHTYEHPHLCALTAPQIRSELTATQAIQYALTGRQGRWLRAPFGEWDDQVRGVAAALGLRLAQFAVVTGDPDRSISAGTIVRTVLREAKPGAVVIMHMNGRGWHTAEALPRVIAGLRAKGYSFVRMSELTLPVRGDTPAPGVRLTGRSPHAGSRKSSQRSARKSKIRSGAPGRFS
jgi:peptidoglycan/xylan/chitin deacetylase (PgdA/CDA1 family)